MTKREEKPLENKIRVICMCTVEDYRHCVMSKRASKTAARCEFRSLVNYKECDSPVARANAMVLELQRMGFTVELKKKEGNA